MRFPLFQFGAVVIIILVLQAADENSLLGQIFNVLDQVVEATVKLCSELFKVKAFTGSGLTLGLMIAYVYLVCLLILLFIRVTLRLMVDLLGWTNAFGLRNAIARERVLPHTALKCHWRKSGRPTYRRHSGKRLSHGRLIIDHRTGR